MIGASLAHRLETLSTSDQAPGLEELLAMATNTRDPRDHSFNIGDSPMRQSAWQAAPLDRLVAASSHAQQRPLPSLGAACHDITTLMHTEGTPFFGTAQEVSLLTLLVTPFILNSTTNLGFRAYTVKKCVFLSAIFALGAIAHMRNNVLFKGTFTPDGLHASGMHGLCDACANKRRVHV